MEEDGLASGFESDTDEEEPWSTLSFFLGLYFFFAIAWIFFDWLWQKATSPFRWFHFLITGGE